MCVREGEKERESERGECEGGKEGKGLREGKISVRE